MKKQRLLNKIFILCLDLFVFQNIVVAQDDYRITRPLIEVVDPIFCDLIDTAILEMEKCGHMCNDSFFFYLFEMNGEGNYHCWLEAHSFSIDMFKILPQKWNENVESELFWPEGYFYYNGFLCLVRTSYPGVNFFFSNKMDTIFYPIQDLAKNKTGKDCENGNIFLLLYPSILDNKIAYPFKIEIGCH